MRKLLRRSKANQVFDENQRRGSNPLGNNEPMNGYVTAHTSGIPGAPVQKLRTLQRYHGGPNQERMTFMEKNSALTRKSMAVSAEQVSIFLTAGMAISDLVPMQQLTVHRQHCYIILPKLG